MKKIPLNGKNGEGKFMIVDDDFSPIPGRKLDLTHDGYICIRNPTVSIARLLMQPPDGMEVDHINRNPLDNRKSNLRICTKTQNQLNKSASKNNTSGYKGVGKTRTGKWYAQIRILKKKKWLGVFKSPTDAALAYNKKAKEIYGEFAWINPVGGSP